MSERIFTKRDLARLAEPRGGRCVSLYLPTHRAGREIRGDWIELKNLLHDARVALAEKGMRKPDIDQLLHEADALLDDDDFWRHQADGLAAFCAPGEFHEFRLPQRFETRSHVGERFYLKPLLPLLSSDGRFFILTLSQSEAELFETTRHAMDALPLGENGETKLTPEPDRQAIPSQQFHSHQAPTQGRGPKKEAMYHGHADAGREGAEIEHFFRRVEDRVQQHLGGESAPLVLACVGFLAPIYEAVSRYDGLVKGKVPGHPSSWSEDELREKAWGVVQPQFAKVERDALEEFESLRGKRTAGDLDGVLKAATEGRIKTLFLSRGAQIWGNYDPSTGEITRNGDAEDPIELLDMAAVRTLTTGGDVFALPEEKVPGDEAAAALLRY